MASRQAGADQRLLSERRQLGAFYTPDQLSEVLARWAITSPCDTVLEPSFGGCGLLQAAAARLANLGAKNPKTQIFGCDIDPVAFEHLASVLGSPIDLDRFIQTDFLEIGRPAGWPNGFRTILANPPYIPYQAIPTAERSKLIESSRKDVWVGGRASLWAHFLVRSLELLGPRGRMAWVLPGAFLQADYARELRPYLARSFERSAAFLLRERIFTDVGAEEETVVLLAAGYRQQSDVQDLALYDAASIHELSALIGAWDRGELRAQTFGSMGAANLALSHDDDAMLAMINANAVSTMFGDVARVKIGLVTGANSFFVLSSEKLVGDGLEHSDCKPILAKFKAAAGLAYSIADHLRYAATGGAAYLVHSEFAERNHRIDRYLERFPKEKIPAISTFKKRTCWSAPDDGFVPDAFFPVMHHHGPRLVLNPDGATCTNTIHRVQFLPGVSEARRQLCSIAMMTSYSQLSAELVGRRYGSGVLKHEPRDAEQIQLLLPECPDALVDDAFKRIDGLLRSNDPSGAARLADEFIYGALGEDNWIVISSVLSSALAKVRGRRRL